MNQSLCEQFARILGGEYSLKNGVCTVEKGRPHIRVSIMGRSSGSVLHSMCSFESLDSQGKALNLGETALLQEEVFPYLWHLNKNGMLVSALHNHWLFDAPQIMYVHFMSIEEPLAFARKAAEANAVLK